jgi:hypothetical protein
MKTMKHLKMFESFSNYGTKYLSPEDISRPGDTVFMFNEGDGYRVALLNKMDSSKFIKLADKLINDDFFYSSTSKPGIAYCLGFAAGDIEFKGPDFENKTDRYEWRISSGMGDQIEQPEGNSSDLNSEDYLFTLKKGYVTTFNAHGQVESISIHDYIKYMEKNMEEDGYFD